MHLTRGLRLSGGFIFIIKINDRKRLYNCLVILRRCETIVLKNLHSWGGIHEKSQESCTSGQVFDILHSVRYDHKDLEKDRKQLVSALWRLVCNKSHMAANGFSPCSGFAPICRKTLCNTTISRFSDVKNPFLRSILCFIIILKVIAHFRAPPLNNKAYLAQSVGDLQPLRGVTNCYKAEICQIEASYGSK